MFKILLLCMLVAINVVGASFTLYEREQRDHCNNTIKCRCSKNNDYNAFPDSLQAHCVSYEDDLLNKLPLAQIAQLKLTNVTSQETDSILKKLRSKIPRLGQLDIRDSSKLPKIDIQWLPDHLKVLTVRESKPQLLFAVDPKANCQVEKHRLSGMQKIILRGSDKVLKIECLPDTIQTMLLMNIVLPETITWPKSLRSLRVAEISRQDHETTIFNNLPKRLRVLWVTYFPQQNGEMPVLTLNNNTRAIYFQSSNISKIKEDLFISFSNLSSLNLARNSLTHFNAKLPRLLTYLNLQSNLIKDIQPYQWSDTKLRTLTLAYNNLSEMPLGLPETIISLRLDHNSITHCPPEAFSTLHKLTVLDLSHNKLSIMPSGIQSFLNEYDIEHNLLSHVPGPEAYEFCKHCHVFKFKNNEWLCEMGFFQMALWIVNEASNEIIRTFIFNRPFSPAQKCTNIPKEAFRPEYLYQTSKFIKHISKPPFTNCSYDPQRILNCTKQNLKVVPDTPPDGLKKIIIEVNKDLKFIPDNIFAPQKSLKYLYLEQNALKRIPYGLPSSLRALSLRENNITELSRRDEEAFEYLVNLEDLFLEDNKLKHLYSYQFTNLKKLDWIGLGSNELMCDCSLHSFVMWYTNFTEQSTVKKTPLTRYPTCLYPSTLKHRDIRRLRWIFMYEYKCVPAVCLWNERKMEPILNCSLEAQETDKSWMFLTPDAILGEQPTIPENVFWKVVSLSGLQLRDQDIKLNHLKHLVHVDLSKNLLTRLPLRVMPRRVEELLLSHNQIASMQGHQKLMQVMPNLRHLDLRNNKIVRLNQEEVHFMYEIKSIQVESNPFICDCSLGNFVAWVEAKKSARKRELDFEKLRCNEPKKLENRYINSLKKEELCEAIPVSVKVGCAIAAFAVIFTIVIVLIIQMRRKQQRKAQILYAFQKLIQQEAAYNITNIQTEDESQVHTYDAFIASDGTPKNGDFLDKLIKELEQQRNYRLCIPERDFAPGSDFAESIIECIGASKKIILILSKSFVTSSWCQFEVQIALTELHQRQRKLLLPIMIEKVTQEDDLPGGVQSLLFLIPSLNVPSKMSLNREWGKFWKTIEIFLNK